MSDAAAEFAADWEASLRDAGVEPPRLGNYVPDGSEVRLAVLAELVRVDLHRRWRRTGRAGRRVTDYAREFPELQSSPLFVELVCEEYELRRHHQQIAVREFTDEYPELSSQLLTRLSGEPDPHPGSPAVTVSSPGIEAGSRLDDFDLLTALGGDEVAKVFLARQRSMQRLVAVRIEAEAGQDAHTVAQLDHQYIVRVFDQRMVPGPVEGVLRLRYMQYLPGGTGADLVRLRRSGAATGGALLLRSVDAAVAARGEIRPADSSVRAEIAALSWPETVAWVGRRLATALDYAGHQGVPHRAIQPANVLFTAEGIPKLADFSLGGTAVSVAARRDRLGYCSPEQLAELTDPAAPEPDERSDIYSLAVLLWEMLTGARPFEDPPDETDEPVTAALRLRRAGVGDAAIARLPADTPATLRRVLLQCLQVDPARRRTGADLAGQLELCLDPRARDLVDPPPRSLRYRARGALAPIAVVCVGVPNLLASLYNVRLNQVLIIDRLSAVDQHRFATVVVLNNLIAFGVAGVLILLLCRRPFMAAFGLVRSPRPGRASGGPGGGSVIADPARVRAQTLSIGDRLVWVPFVLWLLAGIAWPMALMGNGVVLPARNVVQFYTAQVVCAAIALAYPFFLVSVYAVRSVYPQLLAVGGVGPQDGRQLRRLQRRSNVYLGAAAAVPLLGVASATFVPADQLVQVIGPVRMLSVGGIAAFVLTYWLFRLLEADLRALERAIPRGAR